MAKHNEIGKKAEDFAADYLHSAGYTVRFRNWKFKHLEIDIIAEKSGTTAIVEVKFRSGSWNGAPENAVDQKKIKHLIVAANAFASAHGVVGEIRFDIIAVRWENHTFQLEHLQDAFYHFLK